MNAAQEPRRYELWLNSEDRETTMVEASTYDAQLAETPALKAALPANVGYAVLASSWTWLHSRSYELAEPVLGPAHPDFLTTSATESREAKGGKA